MVTLAPLGQDKITFEEFRAQWLQEFEEGDLTSVEKGQRFAVKLVTQWLDVSADDDDMVICDGSGDGGIDIAFLRRSEILDTDRDEQSAEGDTWYLIQSKYGMAFQGQETIVSEGRKSIGYPNG